MSSVLLVHWNRAEGEANLARLEKHGHEVALHWQQDGTGVLTRMLSRRPPDCVRLTDLDSNIVRAFGLDQGLVDTKVCAIDAVWSGLRFQRRRR